MTSGERLSLTKMGRGLRMLEVMEYFPRRWQSRIEWVLIESSMLEMIEDTLLRSEMALLVQWVFWGHSEIPYTMIKFSFIVLGCTRRAGSDG